MIYFIYSKGGFFILDLTQITTIAKNIGVFTLIGWLVKEVAQYYKNKRLREEQTFVQLKKTDKQLNVKINTNHELLKCSLKSLLHHELYSSCNVYIQRGYITVAERDDLGYLYEAYKNVGGNGTGEIIYKQAVSLPLKKDV